MLYVLFGGDLLALRKRLAALRAQADAGTGMLDTSLTVLDGAEATAEAILGAAMAVPFLAPRRMVIASGLLDRFAGGQSDRDSRRREQPAARGQRGISTLEPLFEVLAKEELPPTTDLVVTGLTAARGRRNPLLSRLRQMPNASVEEFRPPQRTEVVRFVRDEGSARGIRWAHGGRTSDGDPVARLAERLPADTMAMASELDKLALYTMGREATARDIDEICSGEKESTSFNLVDATMDGDAAAAIQHLLQLRRRGTSMQALMGLVASSYRRLAIIRDHLDAGDSSEEIGKAIGLPWPGLRDRAIARARRHSVETIRVAYGLVIEADRRMKRGEVDEDLTIEILLFSLAALAPLNRSRRGITAGRPRR